jgi:hypothetical protein
VRRLLINVMAITDEPDLFLLEAMGASEARKIGK